MRVLFHLSSIVELEDLLDSDDIELSLSKCIGKGYFGEVYVGYFRGAQCAFKRCDNQISYFAEGVLFDKVTQHPCIPFSSSVPHANLFEAFVDIMGRVVSKKIIFW